MVIVDRTEFLYVVLSGLIFDFFQIVLIQLADLFVVDCVIIVSSPIVQCFVCQVLGYIYPTDPVFWT